MNGGVKIDHHVDDKSQNVQHGWNTDIEPVLHIQSGDVIKLECRDVMDGQIDESTSPSDVHDLESRYPLTGPVYVEGAQPGQMLQVDLLDIEHKGWGFTTIWPPEWGYGILRERFEEPYVYIWELEGETGYFVNDIEIPLNPFPGTIGCTPQDAECIDPVPPFDSGGNMDIKHLTVGAKLFLPIPSEGALFSVGDCHAAQGDGEVGGGAIEAPMSVTVKLTLRSDINHGRPYFETDHPFTARGKDEPMVGMVGINTDLRDAAKVAVNDLVDYLVKNRNLTEQEAYILCSVAADLKINQLVNKPSWVVSAYMPQSIFPE